MTTPPGTRPDTGLRKGHHMVWTAGQRVAATGPPEKPSSRGRMSGFASGTSGGYEARPEGAEEEEGRAETVEEDVRIVVEVGRGLLLLLVAVVAVAERADEGEGVPPLFGLAGDTTPAHPEAQLPLFQ